MRRWRWEGQTWQEKDHVEDEQGTIWVFEHKVRALERLLWEPKVMSTVADN